ncbi:MAG: ATP-dependent zinc metalloprotease FtsH [bacterium]
MRAENDRWNDEPEDPEKGKSSPGGGIWKHLLVIFILTIIFYELFLFGSQKKEYLEIPYSEFKEELARRNVKEVITRNEIITGEFFQAIFLSKAPPVDDEKGFRYFSTRIPKFGDQDLMRELIKAGATVRTDKGNEWILSLMIFVVPWFLILGFFWYTSKKLNSSQTALFNRFNKSGASLYKKTKSNITFNDVAGLTHAKQELMDIVSYLKEPKRYERLGGKIPRGVLLMGPPGTGKTLMARAVAGEADVPFYSISGSQFIEMFVGVGASRVRDLFGKAKKNAPSIVFIDEIDSVGRYRGAGLGGGQDEREQTLNQILAEMDGFGEHHSVVVIAATNRPDVLDPALIRPGRFDRQVVIERPHREGRLQILKVHTRKVRLAPDVNLELLAQGTPGFSGADLENMVNEAAIDAARQNKDQVYMEDLEKAKDKVILGGLREDLLNEEEKRIVAYHEAGHTLVAKSFPDSDPIHKVTIIPRGRSLGVTEQLPKEDQHNYFQSYLLHRLVINLGGRAAEKLVFNDVTSGAENDLKQATQLARRMICHWGMSERLGPVAFRHGEGHVFLGKEIAQEKDYSERTAVIIDQEVQALLQAALRQAESILRENRRTLDRLAGLLIEREVLSEAEIQALIAEAEREPQETDDGKRSTTAVPGLASGSV